jgi:hypothetical protein
VAQDGDWVMITANSEPAVLLFNQRTGALGWTETGQWDCWADGSFVACPDIRYSATELVPKATIAKLQADIRKIAEELGVGTTQLLAEITSDGGQQVRDAIQSSSEQLTNLANDYLQWAKGKTVPPGGILVDLAAHDKAVVSSEDGGRFREQLQLIYAMTGSWPEKAYGLEWLRFFPKYGSATASIAPNGVSGSISSGNMSLATWRRRPPRAPARLRCHYLRGRGGQRRSETG